MSVRRLLGATATALALLTATASAQAAEPAKIQPPAGNTPYLTAHAAGVQVYACSSTADGPKWSFVEPRAVLYGDRFNLLGTHYVGPTWQATDGSLVKGQKVDGVTVDPTAIPWLLLKAVSTAPGAQGDRFVPTTYIQRLNTRGGLEPAAAQCSAATIGAERQVPYTADYRFWKATA
jgi:hypothetical protein